MNLTRLRQRDIDTAPLEDLVHVGLITQQEADAIADYKAACFVNDLQRAIQEKGYATAEDIHREPSSQILKRLRKGTGQVGTI